MLHPAGGAPIQRLLEKLGYQFRRVELLHQALTHRSFGTPHNERLEFLGDSVLNCVIATELYHRFPRLPEGDLSRARAQLVKQDTLHELAQTLRLGEYIQLGEGELRSGGHRRPSILADAVEAIIGAIYLDLDFNAAARTVVALYQPLLDQIDPKTLGKDAKTRLQEYLQANKHPLPVYEVTATTGEAHAQHFDVVCIIQPLGIRTAGYGNSRRQAEQEAARLAFEQLVK